jgi:hypothetical protein
MFQQPVLDMTPRAFKVLVATMHGVQLTAEQVAGYPNDLESRTENINASAWLNNILFPQIVTVCAIAEYLGCISTIGPAMMAILQSAPRFWQAVAYSPLQHLTLAMKMKNRELYYDAFQYAAAQAYDYIDDVTWEAISAITGMNGDAQQIVYSRQMDKMPISEENLKNDLHRLQTSAGQEQRTQRPKSSSSLFGIALAGSGYEAELDAKEQYTLITRSIFGRWLAEHLYVQKPGLSVPRYRSEDLNVDPFSPYDAPAL